jgi:predicted phage terminase large subunit-like protein
MGKHKDGTFWVLDVVRERVGPKGVRQLIRQTAEADGRAVPVRGSSGRAGRRARSPHDDIVTRGPGRVAGAGVQARGGKAERAEPWAAQVEAGNVDGPGELERRRLDEHRSFPSGAHDDQVDSASGAFRDLTLPAPNVR